MKCVFNFVLTYGMITRFMLMLKKTLNLLIVKNFHYKHFMQNVNKSFLKIKMYKKTFIFFAFLHICRAHRDGGSSQGGTRHSLPPVRRRGGFNSNDQLNSSTER